VSTKKTWIGVLGGGLALGAGLGALIWTKYRSIDADRAEIATLRTNIESSRKQIEGTPALEREVIVLREINELMKSVLPDTDDVNNLVRTLQTFSEDSKVHVSGIKKKPDDTKNKGDFDKVGYTLSLEGDAFQLLEFLNRIESHTRFMRVPTFRIQAAQRSQMEKEGLIAHRIQLDVETFVYEPKKDAKTVKIDGYDRKRDLLLGEVQRRRQDLALVSFKYGGQRSRRDPWIDPRVPAQTEGGADRMPVAEQVEMVQKLAERTAAFTVEWPAIDALDNVIEQMLKRSEFESRLSVVEEELRTLETSKAITYVPAQRRLQTEVSDVLRDLRLKMDRERPVAGPTETQLREIKNTMSHQTERGEYKQVLEAYKSVEKDLALAESDPLRKPLVESIKRIEAEARTVLDFDKIALRFDGRAYVNGQAIAVINGKIVGVGDLLEKELLIHSINRDEIEFLFRGIVFARRF
jgi:Tfp pilus assembly protein PilO